jgi:hypothetical protein
VGTSLLNPEEVVGDLGCSRIIWDFCGGFWMFLEAETWRFFMIFQDFLYTS